MAVTSVNVEFEVSKQDVINGTKSYVCSNKYIDHIVKISVWNVMYHRLPIPENFFRTREFDSIKYKTMQPKYKNSGLGQIFLKWMKGFKDAFDKKYLKEFVLYFTVNDDIKDMYKFKFEYEDSLSKEKACTDMTEPTVSLLKNLTALGEYLKLPMDTGMHVELFYKDGTPEEYHPPLFDAKDIESTWKCKADKENEKYNFENTKMTRISTGFHYLNFSCKRKLTCDSQFLSDDKKVPKRRRTKTSDEMSEVSADGGKKKKRKLNISDSKELESFISIDVSEASRHEISFNNDYHDEMLNDEDIDKIAALLSPQK